MLEKIRLTIYLIKNDHPNQTAAALLQSLVFCIENTFLRSSPNPMPPIHYVPLKKTTRHVMAIIMLLQHMKALKMVCENAQKPRWVSTIMARSPEAGYPWAKTGVT